jgi:four helix bundle protein
MNIAEGSAKRGSREFRRFLDSALGSLAELSYTLLLARDVGYLTPEVWGEIEALRDHAGKLTWGLYRAIRRKPPDHPVV